MGAFISLMLFFIAENDNDVVGFLVGFLSQTDKAEEYIQFVGVHPQYRKAGLARALYQTRRNRMDLVDFIILAKTSGYASGDDGKMLTFKDGAKGFEFLSHGYRYRDRYYGVNPFAGTEQVYDDSGAIIWLMNYYGEMVLPSPDLNRIYTFLKEAMSSITPDYPYRGPPRMEKDNFRYENQQSGTLDRFSGTESIYECNEKIYSLHYHGGKMIQK